MNDVCVILTHSAEEDELAKVNKSELFVVERPVNCVSEQVKFHLDEVDEG